jgi:hypothetical protein
VIPVQEDPEFEVSLDYIMRHSLKKAKTRAGDVAQWWSACTACIRHWVQSLLPPKKKKKILSEGWGDSPRKVTDSSMVECLHSM